MVFIGGSKKFDFLEKIFLTSIAMSGTNKMYYYGVGSDEK